MGKPDPKHTTESGKENNPAKKDNKGKKKELTGELRKEESVPESYVFESVGNRNTRKWTDAEKLPSDKGEFNITLQPQDWAEKPKSAAAKRRGKQTTAENSGEENESVIGESQRSNSSKAGSQKKKSSAKESKEASEQQKAEYKEYLNNKKQKEAEKQEQTEGAENDGVEEGVQTREHEENADDNSDIIPPSPNSKTSGGLTPAQKPSPEEKSPSEKSRKSSSPDGSTWYFEGKYNWEKVYQKWVKGRERINLYTIQTHLKEQNRSIPRKILEEMFQLADLDHQRKLDLDQFRVLMFLVTRYLNKGQVPPRKLPYFLVPPRHRAEREDRNAKDKEGRLSESGSLSKLDSDKTPPSPSRRPSSRCHSPTGGNSSGEMSRSRSWPRTPNKYRHRRKSGDSKSHQKRRRLDGKSTDESLVSNEANKSGTVPPPLSQRYLSFTGSPRRGGRAGKSDAYGSRVKATVYEEEKQRIRKEQQQRALRRQIHAEKLRENRDKQSPGSSPKKRHRSLASEADSFDEEKGLRRPKCAKWDVDIMEYIDELREFMKDTQADMNMLYETVKEALKVAKRRGQTGETRRLKEMVEKYNTQTRMTPNAVTQRTRPVMAYSRISNRRIDLLRTSLRGNDMGSWIRSVARALWSEQYMSSHTMPRVYSCQNQLAEVDEKTMTAIVQAATVLWTNNADGDLETAAVMHYTRQILGAQFDRARYRVNHPYNRRSRPVTGTGSKNRTPDRSHLSPRHSLSLSPKKSPMSPSVGHPVGGHRSSGHSSDARSSGGHRRSDGSDRGSSSEVRGSSNGKGGGEPRGNGKGGGEPRGNGKGGGEPRGNGKGGGEPRGNGKGGGEPRGNGKGGGEPRGNGKGGEPRGNGNNRETTEEDFE